MQELSEKRVWKRIVGVQGAAQLVSAVAALLARNKELGLSSGSIRAECHPVENHLIIHDLSTNPEQAMEFAQCLRDLAGHLIPWDSIRYFGASEIGALQNAMKCGGMAQTLTCLQDLLGIEQVDDLFLGQNLLFLNCLLAHQYPSANKYCYGDGIGINFSAEYYAPQPVTDLQRLTTKDKLKRIGRSLERKVRHAYRSLTSSTLPALVGTKEVNSVSSAKPKSRFQHRGGKLSKEKFRVPFDRKYLLLPNMLDEIWDNYVQLSATDFADCFEAIANKLHRYDGDGKCERLMRSISRFQQTIVILSSNFSETKRMTKEGELAAYLHLAESLKTSSSAQLVIKPHPRDSYEKIHSLQREATKRFSEVVVLDHPWTFYVPFESIYLRYMATSSANTKKISIVCSSSAGLSLEYLYGQKCLLGFGKQTVLKHFAPEWADLRLVHEDDLNRITQTIRKSLRYQEKHAA